MKLQRPKNSRRQKWKQRKNNKHPVRNMVDVNPIMSVITLNNSGPNALIKSQIFRMDKRIRLNYILSTRNLL